jgi:ArsR family transcriptional regulator
MKETKNLALLFKAVSDETRLKIIEILSCGEMCACDILEYFHITQPTLSYHMKTLTDSGLVTVRKESSWMKYNLNLELIAEIKQFWISIQEPKEDCICHSIKGGGKTCES